MENMSFIKILLLSQSTGNWCDRPSRLIKSPSASLSSKTMQQQQHHAQTFSSASIRQGKHFYLSKNSHFLLFIQQFVYLFIHNCQIRQALAHQPQVVYQPHVRIIHRIHRHRHRINSHQISIYQRIRA